MLERCTRATLVFDLAAVADNLAALRAAATASGITALFAAKSFPHPRVYALAAATLDGFDVASPGELASVPHARIVSIADPTGTAIAAAATARAERLIVGCETPAQIAAAPTHAAPIPKATAYTRRTSVPMTRAP